MQPARAAESPPLTPLPPRDLVTGALLIMGSELLFATMGAAVKWAAAGLPIAMIVLGRSVFALVPFVPLLWRGAGPSLRPTPGVWPLYLLRGALGLSAMACFFYALAHLALADGMLLKMTAPIFMPVIGALWLAERPSRAAMVAVPVGLVGVAFVLEPQGELAPAAVVGLAGGVLAGGAKVSVRRLTRTEPASRVVVGFAVLASLLSAPFAVAMWQWPSVFEWGLLVTIGLCAAAGQWLLTRGYQAASPAQIGPFTYSSVLFAAAYGALLWGEMPDWAFAVGAVLIAAAGLLAIRRDTPRAAASTEET